MRKILVLLAVCLFVSGSMAFGDDLYPPPWRGDPLSYLVEWDSFVGDGSAPDSESSVDDNDPATFLYHAFSTHIDFDGEGWVAGNGSISNPGRDGSFACNVVNWVDWEPEKWLRIQIAYTPSVGGAPSIIDVLGNGADPPNGSGAGIIYDSAFLNRYDEGNYFYEDWIIMPNPDWEQIQVFVPMGTSVDQIVIDTVSLPEPSTLVLMCIGAFGLLLNIRRGR